MAYPYCPHVTKLVVTLNVEGRQMERYSQTVTLDAEIHGREVCQETADALASVIALALATVKLRSPA